MPANDRPYALAFASGAAAVLVGLIVVAAAVREPDAVLLGLKSAHSPKNGDDPLASCLDCHVPFLGTPASRCVGPGCHGELATGAPPWDQPAMPTRFHVALRAEPCGNCHREHGEAHRTRTSTSAFLHEIIPERVRTDCARCHRGSQARAHSPTDAIACQRCHRESRWSATVDHGLVSSVPCDECHRPPADVRHAVLAGTCSTCHSDHAWSPTLEPPRAQRTRK